MSVRKAGPPRARPRRRLRLLLLLLLLTAQKPGLDRAELCLSPKGGGPGEGRFVPRSCSQNRVRLTPAVFPVQGCREWGWPGAAQPPEEEAEAEMGEGGLRSLPRPGPNTPRRGRRGRCASRPRGEADAGAGAGVAGGGRRAARRGRREVAGVFLSLPRGSGRCAGRLPALGAARPPRRPEPGSPSFPGRGLLPAPRRVPSSAPLPAGAALRGSRSPRIVWLGL